MIEFTEVFDELNRAIYTVRDDIIKKAIHQLLKREPTFDDYVKCTIVFKQDFDINACPHNFNLYYEGIILGYVAFDIIGPLVKATFKPDKRYEN